MNHSSFDTSVRPQDDYFGYINNLWLRDNPIPPTESTWGTFYVLRDNAAKAVHDIFKDLQSSDNAALSHDQLLLKTFFDVACHFDNYRDNHLAFIRKQLDEVNAISTSEELAYYLGKSHRQSQSPFWTLYVDHDDKDSSRHVLRFHQSGLTLPNRDYYLDDSDHMRDIRLKYEHYYLQMQKHLPDIITTDWQSVIDIETELASQAWTNVELRDIEKNYNPTTLSKLAQLYSFDWTEYFKGLGWSNPNDAIVISQPSYLKSVIERITDLDRAKEYLRWHVLSGYHSWIDATTAQITFEFFGTAINGMTEMKPLWKRAVLQSDGLVIGEAVGREYAKRHFPETSKTAVSEIVETVRAAYHARLDQLAWMSDSTKKRAHTKLDNISVFIGYPSVWKDFSSISLTDNNHLENLVRLREFHSDLDIAKIGNRPADEEWEMNAHTVNAYHHPNRLEIVFPAAILQPPFYDPAASLAANYGGVGAVVGHELTHGFDDQGADFDENGNTNRWQTPDERKAFDALAEHIVKQADAFETVPGVHLQGKLILGEAIADVGGLELAIKAYEMKSSDQKTDPELKELFENFARCECAHATLERAIELAKVDPHPPSRFRVNCVVCHVNAFYDTYGVTKNDDLYTSPEKRAKIW
ncbi:MAG: M13 family metallopeptidase [Candidatus Saccharimonadales bacterium]